MTAYLIGDLDIFDMSTIEDYRAKHCRLSKNSGGEHSRWTTIHWSSKNGNRET